MKIKKILAVTCACLIGLASVGIAEVSDVISDDFAAITAHAASSGVPIDATHFPDAKFRQSILDGLDKDKNGYLSTEEAAVATYLHCDGEDITSLKGIEYLTELTLLHCYDNQLTELDLSKNTKLESLICSNNKLKELNVSNCTKLTTLECGNFQSEFYKYKNELTALDVSDNTKLTHLNCFSNKLKKLNVSKNTALEYLDCSENELTELDMSKNDKLAYLFCDKNKLTLLNISKNSALAHLSCSYNQFTKLDVSKNTKLEDLNCSNNNLKELDISNCPKIITAYTKGDDSTENEVLAKDYWQYKTDEYGNTTTTCHYYMYWDKTTKIITESKPHTHTWDSGKVTKAATYGATGTKTYTCKVCGAKKTSSIAKKTVKKLTAKTTYSCTTNAVRINWNKLSGVTGYKIFRYDDAKKKWVAVKAIYNPNTTNYKISGLKAGTVYKFRVKAFVKENGKFYFGESCSTISTATRPNTTTVTKANKTSTAVRLFWKKTTCSGYRILRYDSAKKKWVRVTAVGSSATTQYKISGLKKNTTYKFKVQPYVKVGSKVIDGAASAVFTVKTSK